MCKQTGLDWLSSMKNHVKSACYIDTSEIWLHRYIRNLTTCRFLRHIRAIFLKNSIELNRNRMKVEIGDFSLSSPKMQTGMEISGQENLFMF